MTYSQLYLLFNFDWLALILMCLVGIITLVVGSYAKRYLEGDSEHSRFKLQLVLLCLAVMLMLAADNLVLFFIAACTSNALLIRLMIHKPQWAAAKASGKLTASAFVLGAVFMAGGFSLLALSTGKASISGVLHAYPRDPLLLQLGLALLLLSAMVQSALWPFHRWLLSSLNSPTPVSALMHAGLINGGGFLLARFAPLYFGEPNLLLVIFSLGIISATLGTLWKLMQTDVKRMLACSTMGQMGFMFVQCGLGLFPAAVAHLCWHGFFKAYLFLNAATSAQQNRDLPTTAPGLLTLCLALLSGILGGMMFMFTSGKDFTVLNTNYVLVVLAIIASTQFALTLVYRHPWQNLLSALILTAIGGAVYGGSVYTITWLLSPLMIGIPQPLSVIHIIGIGLLSAAWLAVLYGKTLRGALTHTPLFDRAYVTALNASQPAPSTVTTHRQHYHYQ